MVVFKVINSCFCFLLFIYKKKRSVESRFQVWQNLVNAVFEHRTHLKFEPLSLANKGTHQGFSMYTYIIKIIYEDNKNLKYLSYKNFFIICIGKSESFCENTRTITNRLYDIQQGKSHR